MASVEPICSECDKPIYGEVFPCQTHRWCFILLDGPYDEEDEDEPED